LAAKLLFFLNIQVKDGKVLPSGKKITESVWWGIFCFSLVATGVATQTEAGGRWRGAGRGDAVAGSFCAVAPATATTGAIFLSHNRGAFRKME